MKYDTQRRMFFYLRQHGIDEETRHNMIFDITGGRSSSARDLTDEEAEKIIRSVRQGTPGDRIRKAIFSVCYEMDIINKKMTNAAKLAAINQYIQNSSKIGVKKDLNAYTPPELQKLYYQFRVFLKWYLSKKTILKHS